jgi:hypothetical protein
VADERSQGVAGGNSGRFSLHFESLLRVHLSPYGTKGDLIRALESARAEALELLRTAVVVGTEFVEGRHQFQDQVHLRAMLFEFLWRFGLTMHAWAERWIERVGTWPDLRGRRDVRSEAIRLIDQALTESPIGKH